MRHALPCLDEALHLIYHIALLVLKADRQFRLSECNSALILIYKALASGSWLPWKWNSFLDTFLHAAANCSEMWGLERHLCAASDVKMSKVNSFWPLTIVVGTEEEARTRTHVWNALAFMDLHTEFIDSIKWKIHLKIQMKRWPTHLVSKQEIPQPGQDSGCQEAHEEAWCLVSRVWPDVLSVGEVGGRKMILRHMLCQGGTGRVEVWCLH